MNFVRYRSFALVLLSVFSLFLAREWTASAQSPPEGRELQAAVAGELPDFLIIEEFSLEAPSSTESGGNRRLIYEFRGVAVSSDDLFGSVREVGPFSVVVPTHQKGDEIHFSGLLDLMQGTERWKYGVSFKEGFERYGMPVTRFGGPVLIAGAPVDEAMLETAQAQIEAERISELQQEINKKAEAIRLAGEEQLRREQEKAAAQLLALIAEHSEKRGQLIAEKSQELSELSNGLAFERQSLTRQIAQAEDVKLLQARLKALLDEIAVNDATAIQDFAGMRAARVEILSALPKKWIGVVQCQNEINDADSASTTLEIDIDRVVASGFAVTYYVNGNRNSGNSGNLGAGSILNDTMSFPLDVQFSAPRLSGVNQAVVPDGFTLQITADGKLRGREQMMLRWNYQQPSKTTCSFELSG